MKLYFLTHSATRRTAIRTGALITAAASATLLAGCGGSSSNAAADFPPRELTIIAAGDAGGGLDQAARQLETGFQDAEIDSRLKIENNGGGGGNPARAEVIERGSDGATVVTESNRVFLNPLTGTTDMTIDDFTAIAQITNDYLVWAVRADSEFESATDVLDRVKSDPSSVAFGVGTIPADDQINILKAAKEYGVGDLKSLNIVAFQSGGDLNTELLGNHVDVVSTGFSEASSLAESGDIRLLSISAPERQGGAAKGVPTWNDLGLDFTVDHWRGVFGAADMPEEAVTWWQDNIKAATKTDAWAEQMEAAHLTTDFRETKEFTQNIKEQKAEYESLLKEVGLVE